MKKLWIIFASTALLFGCSNNKDVDESNASDNVSIDADTIFFLNSGELDEGVNPITVTAHGDWRLTGPQEWCAPSSLSGKSGDKVAFSAQKNTTGEARTAVFTFINGSQTAKMVVKQDVGNVFGFTQTTYNIYKAGEKIRVTVLKNVNLTYAISDDAQSWLTDVTDPAAIGSRKPEEPLYLHFQVAKNDTKDSRSGTITFKDPAGVEQSVTVNQYPVEDVTAPAQTSYNVEPDGEILMIDLQSNIDCIAMVPAEHASWIKQVEAPANRGVTARKIALQISRAEHARIAAVSFKTPAGTTLPFSVTVKQTGSDPVMADIPAGGFLDWLVAGNYVLARDGRYEVTGTGLEATTFALNSKNLTTLSGIEHFPRLTSLNLSYNKLTSLDLSHNTALASLTCPGNQITSLDLSANTALTTLDCSNNKLTGMDLSANTALTTLNCSTNSLPSLDLSANTALTSLTCTSNQFSTLDLSANTKLTTVNSSYNPLKELNLSANTALTSVTSTDCRLRKVNLDGCVLLRTLSLGYNPLEELILDPKATGFTYLTLNTLYWRNSPSGNLYSTELKIVGGALTSVNCYNNQLVELDVAACTSLTSLSCYGNKLTKMNIKGCDKLTSLSCYNNKLASLDITGKTALTSVDCSNNLLTALDVSANTKLTSLNCGTNQLTSLDVMANTALTSITCSANQLTTLDVSTCSKLFMMNCTSNPGMTTLYMSSGQTGVRVSKDPQTVITYK